VRKLWIPIPVFLVLLFALGGCNMPGVSDAMITGFSADVLAAVPLIDQESRIAAVTVVPMDLADFSRWITISDGATLEGPAVLEDGEEAIWTVTAENGDTAQWKVTVTVQYGISFRAGGTLTVLTGGMKHSTDTAMDAQLGGGIPGIELYSGITGCNVFESVLDLADSSAPEPRGCYFRVDGQSAEASTGYFQFEGNYNLSVTIREFGTLGEDFIAAFSGAGSEIEGFAKLRIVEYASL